MSKDRNNVAIRQAAHQGKEFLISKVLQEAELENIPLSNVEQKMLYFSESDESLPDIYEVNDQFQRECDNQEYEAKISRLIRNAYERDRKESPETPRRWKEAIRALQKEDHYILVMVDQALSKIRPPGDIWRLIGTAVAITAVLGILIFFTAIGSISDWWTRLPARLVAFAVIALWIAILFTKHRVWGEVFRTVLGSLGSSLGLKRSKKRPPQ